MRCRCGGYFVVFQNLDHQLTQWLLSVIKYSHLLWYLKISLWIMGLLLFDILPKSAFVVVD